MGCLVLVQVPVDLRFQRETGYVHRKGKICSYVVVVVVVYFCLLGVGI